MHLWPVLLELPQFPVVADEKDGGAVEVHGGAAAVGEEPLLLSTGSSVLLEGTLSDASQLRWIYAV